VAHMANVKSSAQRSENRWQLLSLGGGRTRVALAAAARLAMFMKDVAATADGDGQQQKRRRRRNLPRAFSKRCAGDALQRFRAKSA